MGMFDNLKKKATAAVDQHGDKIASGIDKAADLADKKTKGKHGGQISKGASAAKNALDKLDGRDDDIPNDPAAKPKP
jgi:MT0933-like antitoxin protein